MKTIKNTLGNTHSQVCPCGRSRPGMEVQDGKRSPPGGVVDSSWSVQRKPCQVNWRFRLGGDANLKKRGGWRPEYSGGALGVDFWWILVAIWDLLGSPFSIILGRFSRSIKLSFKTKLVNNLFNTFGTVLENFLNTVWTTLKACDSSFLGSGILCQHGLGAWISNLFGRNFTITVPNTCFYRFLTILGSRHLLI